MKAKAMELNRRQFIKVSLVTGTGLLVACHTPIRVHAAAPDPGVLTGGGFVPNAWIRIAPDDTVTVMIKHTELGQGTSTGLCMIVADKAARSMSGVRDVVILESGVGVVAETFWQAQNAVHALKIQWKGGDAGLSSESIMAHYAGKIQEDGVCVRKDGDAEEAMKRADRRIQAVYELPYQAHACPEPMNCTAYVLPDRCEVWAPTQAQEPAREVAARITGLPLRAVQVHTPFVGGGFGRRYMPDFVAEAVRLSKAVKAPVKVIWSREEDMRNDHYRPAFYNWMEAGLDRDGYPVAWIHKAVGQSETDPIIESAGPSVFPQWLPPFLKYPLAGLILPFVKRSMGPKGAMSGSADMAYGIEHVRIEYVQADAPVPVGPWRSVADSRNAFVKESFMDEIAAVSGKDPVDLRLRLLKEAPKHRAVLEQAATKAGWGKRRPDGVFQGVAIHAFHGTPVAMVADVSVEKAGRVRVHRVTCAVDCGTAVNPKMVRAQIVGGVVFGLTATLKSELHIQEGRVREGNFHDFPILRMDEAPRVEVHIVKSAAPPNGVGEVGVPPVAPAVTNALFQATGKRIRRLPVNPVELARRA